MIRRARRALAGVIVLALAAQISLAQAPTITHVLPSAVAPARTTRVTVHGSAIAPEAKLWTSFPADVVLVSRESQRATFDVRPEIAAKAGDVGIVRVYGASGVSNPLLMIIDDLPSIAESGSNGSIAAAQAVDLPVAIDGVVEQLASDFYAFEGKKGQRVAVEVMAARLGSRLDPLVRLLDAKGSELAWSDDDPAAGDDGRCAVVLPADGRYIVEMRDTAYEGSEQHRYRLRIGGFEVPLAEAVTAARAPVDDRNDAPAEAPLLSLPFSTIGLFERPGDRDCYRFDAKKGQRVRVESLGRGIGSPCDVSLRLLKPDGSTLGSSKDDDPGEAVIHHRFAEDGTYVVIARELSGQHGPRVRYRLAAGPDAGFSLSIDADKFDAPPGGTFELKITAVRRDMNDPIVLSIDSPGQSFDIPETLIRQGQTEATVKVKALPTLKPGQLLHFRVLGRVKGQPDAPSAIASTASVLRRHFPRLLYPLPELDGVIALGITEQKK